MSFNRDNRNSFWRPDGSNEHKPPAPSGSAQPPHSSAFRSGWGRLPSSSDHPAAGGSESERLPSSFKPQAAGGGRWGPSSFKPPLASGGAARQSPPPNFTVVLIAALLLLPGVTQPIADEFTQAYIQRNRIIDPHTQDDIDRAIAAFHQQKPPSVRGGSVNPSVLQQSEEQAPPKGLTNEYVIWRFEQQYVIPDGLRERFKVVAEPIIAEIGKKSMSVENAVNRAILQIHESLSRENIGQIPERESSKIAQKTASQEFFEKVAKHLQTTYRWVTQQIVDGFISDYSSKPIDQLFFSDSTLDTEGNQLKVKSAFFESHFHHADYFFRTSFINPFALIDFHDGVLPVRAFHPFFHRIIKLATMPENVVMNAFVFVYKSESNFLHRLALTLIRESAQADPVYGKWDWDTRRFVKVDSFSSGDILLVMPERILVTDCNSWRVSKPMVWRAGGGSQYGGPVKIGKQITLDNTPENHKSIDSQPSKFDWKDKNAKIRMLEYEKFMLNIGGKQLRVAPA